MRSARIAAALALTYLLGGCAFATPPAGPSDHEGKKPVAAVRETGEQGAGEPASSAALDAYVRAEQVSMAASIDASVYESVGATAIYPSTVVFSYVYANPIDPAAGTEYFDGMITTFQELCDTAVFPAMEEYGVVDPVVVYQYFGPDRTVVWEHTFTKG
jgi:hypothetical protein